MINMFQYSLHLYL